MSAGISPYLINDATDRISKPHPTLEYTNTWIQVIMDRTTRGPVDIPRYPTYMHACIGLENVGVYLEMKI